jgi:hypothetical protein
MKAIVYLRVSSEEQVNGNSLERQLVLTCKNKRYYRDRESVGEQESECASWKAADQYLYCRSRECISMEIIASTIFGRSAVTFGRIRIIRLPSGRRVVHKQNLQTRPSDWDRRNIFYPSASNTPKYDSMGNPISASRRSKSVCD